MLLEKEKTNKKGKIVNMILSPFQLVGLLLIDKLK